MEDIRDYWPVKVQLVKLVKGHTYYPVPSNVVVIKDLGKIIFARPRWLWI
jgi:hypothetical protein